MQSGPDETFGDSRTEHDVADGIQDVAEEDEPSNQPRRPPAARIAMVVIVLILTAGLAVLMVSLLGSDTSTGAASPEDALEGIIQAMNDEDALGMASLIDVEEFGLLIDTLEGSDTDVSGLPGGLDLIVTGGDDEPVTAAFAELGDPQSGLVVASLDGVELVLTRADEPPWGVAVFDDQRLAVFSTGEIDPGSEVQLALQPDGDGFTLSASGRINDERFDRVDERVEDAPMEIVFIENEGRWYLSLGYTIANLAVVAGAVDEPDYGAWRSVLQDEDSGADTPSGAVERLFDAAPTLDLEDGALAIDPLETRLLHDFMPLILEATEIDRREALRDGRIEVIALELSEEIEGSTARVFLDRVVLRFTESGGDTAEMELGRDWCYRFEDRLETISGCVEDDIAGLQDEFDQQLAASGLDLEVDLAEALPDHPFVVTSKRDGNWYISPLATLFGYVENVGSLATSAVGQIQTDAGTGVATALAIGESTEVDVGPDGAVAVSVTPALDQFDDVIGADLAFLAVMLTSDAPLEVQHDIENPGADAVRNTVLVDAGEPMVLVGSSENVFLRTRALLLSNESDDETATVKIDVQLMPVEQLGAGDSVSGAIDENGTPWFVAVDGEVAIEGAEIADLAFDRFPWFEIVNPSAGVLGSPFVFVTGEPGTEFTLTGG
jgi:hypothetical protein